jgi:hypothetical protein
MTWIDDLGATTVQANGVTVGTRRTLNITGGAVTDDPIGKAINISVGGGLSAAAVDILIGVAGAALMGTNTRFFFGCVAPMPTYFDGPQWAKLGYGDALSATEVSKVVGVAGTVTKWEVLFLEPGVGTSHFDFAVFKNGAGTLPGIQLLPDATTVHDSGDIGAGIHFAASDTIGLRIYCDGPNVTTYPSKVWVAVTYLPD